MLLNDVLQTHPEAVSALDIDTARSLTSGEYLFCLLVTPSSQEMESCTLASLAVSRISELDEEMVDRWSLGLSRPWSMVAVSCFAAIRAVAWAHKPEFARKDK